MAVDFFFNPPTVSLPSVATLENEWSNVLDPTIRKQIAYEYQYLRFHVWMLKNIRSTREGCAGAPPYEKELSLSVRAGAIKASILICASIAEAALRAHAERRAYPLLPNSHHRTFGKVLSVWKTGSSPRPDVAPIWLGLEELRESRNRIHLYQAAANPAAYFETVISKEVSTFTNAKAVLSHIKTIRSP